SNELHAEGAVERVLAEATAARGAVDGVAMRLPAGQRRRLVARRGAEEREELGGVLRGEQVHREQVQLRHRLAGQGDAATLVGEARVRPWPALVYPGEHARRIDCSAALGAPGCAGWAQHSA